MNGIEKIAARIEADTQTEIAALNAETAAQCEKICAEYRDRAQTAYEARIRVGTAECKAQKARLVGTLDMEARNHLLQFKQHTINDTFLAAERQLAALPEVQYVEFLARLAAQAAETGEETLIFNEKDAFAVGKVVAKAANALLGEKGHLRVSAETRKISGGVIVKRGNIETNCAIDMLVNHQRDELTSQVAELLFH